MLRGLGQRLDNGAFRAFVASALLGKIQQGFLHCAQDFDLLLQLFGFSPAPVLLHVWSDAGDSDISSAIPGRLQYQNPLHGHVG